MSFPPCCTEVTCDTQNPTPPHTNTPSTPPPPSHVFLFLEKTNLSPSLTPTTTTAHMAAVNRPAGRVPAAGQAERAHPVHRGHAEVPRAVSEEKRREEKEREPRTTKKPFVHPTDPNNNKKRKQQITHLQVPLPQPLNPQPTTKNHPASIHFHALTPTHPPNQQKHPASPPSSPTPSTSPSTWPSCRSSPASWPRKTSSTSRSLSRHVFLNLEGFGLCMDVWMYVFCPLCCCCVC